MPRLIYIAPAHDEMLTNLPNKIEDNTSVDITATRSVNNPLKTTTLNSELIMSEQTTYDLPNDRLLQALDKAHEKGFRDFLHHNRHDERCEAHLKQAADAMINLEKIVTGNFVPCYDNSYLAAAYLVKYHLNHCVLASWAFKSIFERVGVPNTLYICDVGAGTGAGRVGLALALSKYSKQPAIYFDAHEPAEAMLFAGTFFWRAFLDYVPDYFKHYRQYPTPKNPPELPANTVRVVTAFHLSLPWDRYEYGVNNAKKDLADAFRIVNPDLGIFTIHNNKKKALYGAVDTSYDWNKKCGADLDIPNDPGVECKSPLYTDCAVDFGFEVPEAEGDPIKSVRHRSRYRFSSPKYSILFLRISSRYAELLKRERKEAEAKRKAAEKERLRKLEAVAKRKADEQERLQRERLEREQSKEAEAQRRTADEDEAKRKAAKEKRAKLGLSIKDNLPDPWDDISSYLKIDDERIGKVEAIQDYGLFINVEDGLVGLVRISPQGYYKVENFDVGDEVRVQVSSISPKRKHIAFRLLPPPS